MDLPPGFRFHPTDEEIISHYLSPKVINPSFSARAIGEVDLNKCEPWDLPSKAKMGEKEWYFFCQRDRKYPTGMRTNRATESGYWKATGKDKEIFRGRGVLVGMKKTLVFYRGRAPKGEKSNWVMHEYRIEGKSPHPKPSKDEWVVCRVFHKSSGAKKSPVMGRISSFGDLLLDSQNLPPLMDSTTTPSYCNNNNNNNSCSSSRLPSSSGCYLNEDTDAFDFNAAAATFMPSNYFSSMVSGFDAELQPNMLMIHNPGHQAQNPSSTFYSQAGQVAPSSYPPPPPPHFMSSSNNNASMGYLHHQYPALKMQCKVEQLPNHSMVMSDDTGLSTDRNTEISSVVSKHNDLGSYGDLDIPAAAGTSLDLDSMWKC